MTDQSREDALDLLRRVIRHKPWWNGQDKLWSEIYEFVRDADDAAAAPAKAERPAAQEASHGQD